MKTYAEKLRDPRWQEMRLNIMQRDGFRCRQCNSKEKTLNVHHLIYEKKKEPWQYDVDLLVTLCEDCHKGTEDRTNKILMAQITARIRPEHLRMLARFIRDAVCNMEPADTYIDHPIPISEFVSEVLLIARDKAVGIWSDPNQDSSNDIIEMP